ncbi:MAG TPA: TRAFs-binding domain-containing protein [Longimicrobium sp.]|nr:TRAFs-binding domain-containing protein [Longimicrobium sp.]
MSDRPLCFVLMPFGTKKDPAGGPDIDFNRIYKSAIQPAIEDAGLEPIRADEERAGGIIHKAMFERLLLCDYAVADLTTANANVFYELGVRHAARPATTLAIFSNRHEPPFDVKLLRALPYALGDHNAFDTDQVGALRTSLAKRLAELREIALKDAIADSPIFQLLKDEYSPPDIARLKTDVFRDRVRLAEGVKRELAAARRGGEADVEAVERTLGSLDGAEVGVLIDLFLSYRAVRAWGKMVGLYERLSAAIRRVVMVREQLGFALNRLGRRDEAIEVLEAVITEKGPSSETLGILGRVYKDRWMEAARSGNEPLATGFLDRAIDTYLRGFDADLRDSYPGVNALLLLKIKGDERSTKLISQYLPVVKFAVSQRLRTAKADYWDHATLLELAILEGDEAAARKHLSDALAAVREPWELLTTAANLELLQGEWRYGRVGLTDVGDHTGSTRTDEAVPGAETPDLLEFARRALVARAAP